MLLRVSSYKHSLGKHQINTLCGSKQTTTYKLKKIAVLQERSYSCVFYAVLCNFFCLHQNGHKSTYHSKLNCIPCASFYGSNVFTQLQRKSGSTKLFVTMLQKGNNCFKVYFHKSCRAPQYAPVQM